MESGELKLKTINDVRNKMCDVRRESHSEFISESVGKVAILGLSKDEKIGRCWISHA